MKNALRIAAFAFSLVAFGCKSIDSDSIARQLSDKSDFYLVENPSKRRENPDAYFMHEYGEINRRRRGQPELAPQDYERPNQIVGLALSGGGIRSAAFSLGILSGLNAANYGAKTLLQHVDYISSVSGGGWANGAYWAIQMNDEDFFNCLDKLADGEEALDKCNDTKAMLRSEQSVERLAIGDKQRKIEWEADIVDHYLLKCNVNFSKGPSDECWRYIYQRPYPIFNSTHTAHLPSIFTNRHRNFPFQTTPHQIGTLIDCSTDIEPKSRRCQSDRYGNYARGFFANLKNNDFTWKNRRFRRYWCWATRDRSIGCDEPGDKLSTALAHSSGVVPSAVGLTFSFHLKYENQYIKEIRKIYRLSDGGHSENVGILPLVERGSDFIIVSHMGKESSEFDDLKLASKQVKEILGCNVPVISADDSKFVYESEYWCDDGISADGGGKLLHIRPSYRNAEDFLRHLRSKSDTGSQEVLQHLVEERTSALVNQKDLFPQTPTFNEKYDPLLIRAYYLFGKFITNHEVNKRLQEWIIENQQRAPNQSAAHSQTTS